MNNTLPPQWSFDQYTLGWPQEICLIPDNLLPPFSNLPNELQQEWEQDRAVLMLMAGHPDALPVSIKAIEQTHARLKGLVKCWKSFLTFPATTEGFQCAIDETISQQTRPGPWGGLPPPFNPHHPYCLPLLIMLFPKQTHAAFLKAPFQKAGLRETEPIINADLHKILLEGLSSLDNNRDTHSRLKSHVSAGKDSSMLLSSQSHGHRLQDILADIQRDQLTPAIAREMLDSWIKKDILTHKGAGPMAGNYWFEDIGLPALCNLPHQQLQEIMAIWPSHASLTWNNPVQTVSSPHFWRQIRSLRQPERGYVLEHVLPTVVNTDHWSDEQRHHMLQAMLERTKEHGWLFKERLKLWLAWGGDLETPVVLSSAEGSECESAFTAPATQTAREWIISCNNPVWDKVMAEDFFAATPSSKPTPSI